MRRRSCAPFRVAVAVAVDVVLVVVIVVVVVIVIVIVFLVREQYAVTIRRVRMVVAAPPWP